VRVDGIKQTLYVGERLLVRDLVSMMLVESSNDAAYALAAYANERGTDFVAEMNRKAFAIGMQDCRFNDPAGLDDTAFCTARDVVRLVRTALRQAPQLWPVMVHKELTVTSADGKLSHQIKSTNELLGQVPNIIGGKTGNTDGALGCMLLVVKLPGKDDTLISVVLGSRTRFTDTKTIISWAASGWHWQ
jgi:D-alanyl-D-alanine carboxypeptidase